MTAPERTFWPFPGGFKYGPLQFPKGGLKCPPPLVQSYLIHPLYSSRKINIQKLLGIFSGTPNEEGNGAIFHKSRILSAFSSPNSHHGDGHPEMHILHTHRNSYSTDSQSLTLSATNSHQKSQRYTYLENIIKNHRDNTAHQRVKRDTEATLPTSGTAEYEMSSVHLTRSELHHAYAHWFAGQRRVRHGRKKFYNNGDRSGWGGGYG